MPECKGDCNFSSKRYNEIICEKECKERYIESSDVKLEIILILDVMNVTMRIIKFYMKKKIKNISM